MVPGKFSPPLSPEKIPTHQTPPSKIPPGKFSPRKFPPGIFPPISLIIFLHLTLSPEMVEGCTCASSSLDETF